MINKDSFLNYLLKCKEDPNIKLDDDEWSRFVWFVLNFKSSPDEGFKGGLRCVSSMIDDRIGDLNFKSQTVKEGELLEKIKGGIIALQRLQDDIEAI